MSGPTIVMKAGPVRLFGQILPGILAIKSGDQKVIALVKRDGGRTKVLSVHERHGGKLKDVGLTSHTMRRLVTH